MEPNKNGVDINKETPPAPTPDAKGGDQDIDFNKELENLDQPTLPANPPRKSKEEELRQATYTAKQVAKRIRDLGGDPTAAISDDAPPTEAPIDTSRFVTKEDLTVANAEGEARKLARSEGEYKVIMWYVKNKGVSVSQAHLLANEKRLKTVIAEATRSRDTTPSNGGGGPGADRPIDSKVPTLPPEDVQRLAQSNMIWNEEKKAYVGKRMQYRYDEKSKGWVNEKINKS